ncbi:sensor histidine kinase [Coraliomargarita sinensis]|uniref:sensor histidine kinase n=1 Tax=Coraliomargarita sinensis TaxID=2174842 RepID=UPI001305031F|nr:histidine kinase [Coraliomargarita sinensis]
MSTSAQFRWFYAPPVSLGNTIHFYWKRVVLCAFALFPGLLSAFSIFPSLTAPIREEMEAVQIELIDLPVFPVNVSPWTLGFSSAQHQEPELPFVIEITFPEPAVVDLVALMPSSFKDQRNEIQSWGFPLRFMIERLLPDGQAEIIADHRESDYPVPGVDPQFFPCPEPVTTTGLRITITEPGKNTTWWRSNSIVAFSELYAFAGARNAALNSEVKATSSNEFSFSWSTKCLTDGFTLFSPLFHNLEDPKNNIDGFGLKKLTLDFDLGQVYRVDEFRLWPVVHAIQHNFPPTTAMGFPRAIRVKAAISADFSGAEVIYENMNLNYRPGAGPFMRRTRPTDAQYVRFELSEGVRDFMRDQSRGVPRIALSEVEVFSAGDIISRGIPLRAEGLRRGDRQRVSSLTDGRSNEGQILPLRQWLTQFKQRVQLEDRLQSLRGELNAAQLQEAQRFRTVVLVAIGLILILLQLVWLVRVASRRRAARMRERIACDLHDEIGANVSSMAHTTELLAESIREPSSAQTRLLGNLQESAQLTYQETKNFIRFIEAENHSSDIAEQFTRVADQILGTIPHIFSLENTRSFNALDPATKWNLLLFYKEALNNIIKHAEATAVTIKTRREDRVQILEVIDNGRGFSQDEQSCRRLEERATMLRGELKIDSQAKRGTQVTLKFKNC